MHKWTIVAARESQTPHPGVIAVCTECGLIRTHIVVLGGIDDRVDLGGECPGRRGVDRTVRTR